MAHFAGLVAGGVIPSPFPHAHVVTSTTHKTLRGPRGGIVLTNDADLAKKINSAIFPGLQGGPLMHVIAAKAVAFDEALQPGLQGLRAPGGGERPRLRRGAEGPRLRSRLRRAPTPTSSSSTCDPSASPASDVEKGLGPRLDHRNKNGVPNDPQKPMVTSGIRVGTPACTTRGFGVAEFQDVARMIAEVVDAMDQGGNVDEAITKRVRDEAHALTARFPIYAE